MASPPAAIISRDPSGRAKCKRCGGRIPKASLRVTRFVRSRHKPDGFDEVHMHAGTCAGSKVSLDPRSVLVLAWKEQVEYSSHLKAAYGSSESARRENETFCEMVELLNGARPADVKALCEANGYATKVGTKSVSLGTLVEMAADGLAFGLLVRCPVCGSRSLRHAGQGLGSLAISWCVGFFGTSRCTYEHAGAASRESAAWEVPTALREGKPRSRMREIGDAVDARSGVERTDEAEKTAVPCTKRRKVTTEIFEDEASLPNPPLLAQSALLEVDPLVPREGAARVHATHERRTAWNVTLTRVDTASSLNAFYKLQLVETAGRFLVFARWGRVGDTGGTSITRKNCMVHAHARVSDARLEFADRFRSKTGREFSDYALRREFERVPGACDLVRHPDHHASAPPRVAEVEDDASLEPRVASFVALIASKTTLERELARRNIDLARFPLGELAPETIAAAYGALAAASDELERRRGGAETTEVDRMRSEAIINKATDDFLAAVPHVVDKRAQHALRLDSRDVVTEKIALVADLQLAMDGPRLDERNGPAESYAALDCSLQPVPSEDPEYGIVDAYLRRGLPTARVATLFRTARPSEHLFDHADDPNRYLLWHGSPLSNWAGILKNGLRVAPPEAPASGYLFDKGIYAADCAAKSATYCRVDANTDAVLLLVEVACGTPLVLTAPDENANNTRRLNAKDSVFVRGRLAPDPGDGFDTVCGDVKVPRGDVRDRIDPNLVMGHNEYVVYDPSRLRFRFLLRLATLY
ncbi:hypothetical protein CTAYLR_004664 [Chrysophaeum taylorii]|uniref:Poly [ADP-ribose] polymerase n=1 Tax=Chrysophaeum taylorii TaxID=2483200 RepID=A0AAD7U9Q2_9STRA|nr:hypothetical protein CTAYLR_004664 [Chrysophaeum taylorii]